MGEVGGRMDGRNPDIATHWSAARGSLSAPPTPSKTHHADLIQYQQPIRADPLGIPRLVHLAPVSVLVDDPAAHGGVQRGAWVERGGGWGVRRGVW